MESENPNPYATPESIVRRSKIANENIEKLIAGGDLEIVERVDLTGAHLIGGKFRQRLNAEQAKLASEFEGEPVVFQSVLWWCVLIVIPVLPLGVYVVLPYKESEDAEYAKRYRAVLVEWDVGQIGMQYCFFSLFLMVIAVGILGALA